MGRSSRKVVPVCSSCAKLTRELAALREELAELRRQVNRNSGNSSLPPAQNPPWAPRPVVKKPTGNKPGGQIGHEGHHRVLLSPEEVDEVIEHVPRRCTQCGEEFGPGPWAPDQVRHRHQVMELPRRAVKVTEHRSVECRCRRCGGLTREPIPSAVLGSVCGPRLGAAVCFVSARVHGSRRAAGELLADVLGAPLSLGTIIARETEMTGALNEPYRDARAAIRQAPAKNVDETGWKRAGRFLWTAATPTMAVFHLDPCRNRDAMDQLLGKKVIGTVCSDRFGVYQKIPVRQRAICWAHLKRDFQSFVEIGGASAEFGEAGLGIVKQVTDSWHAFRDRPVARATLRKRLSAVRGATRKWLEQNRISAVKRIGTFCRGLLKLEPAMWTFARVEGIEPTNNHAERMLRPAVCWRKTSLGSHSLAGCRFVERMLTVVQTLRLQGRSVMDYLTQALSAWRTRQPTPSLA
jgi:transposase